MTPMQIGKELNEAAERLSHAATHAEQLAATDNHILISEVVRMVKELDHWIHSMPVIVKVEPQPPVEPSPAVNPVILEHSEVEGMNVHEAAEKISRMRSVEKLYHIIATDKRHGVVNAANRRLEELAGEDK